MERIYLCMDLKSFYASVECVDRGLNPMKINLVVADPTRTDKTICLAVSPALKSFGIPGRARLFEVNQRVREINAERRRKISAGVFRGKSCDIEELERDMTLELDYLVAPPRMKRYMEVSSAIYAIYLRYIAPEDIHVYSIDEVFIDITAYLDFYQTTARNLAAILMDEVYNATGITATAGIGTNLYLAKVAMDILAKKMPVDEKGRRIAELDETAYRRELWNHEPLRDFWRVGGGYSRKLHAIGLYTMGDIARYSLSRQGENRLYQLFGINAELLIDHAWGWEPCTIADVKAYHPAANSVSTGQVLQCAYTAEKARVVTMEMIDRLVLDLVEKGLVTNQLVLTIGYDRESLADDSAGKQYKGQIVKDAYGRRVPKPAHGTISLPEHTSSSRRLIAATMELYDRIVEKNLPVRRITIAAGHVISETEAEWQRKPEQLNLFASPAEERQDDGRKEKDLQKAILQIQKKYGKNALLKGMNLLEEATMQERNHQVGGHRA